MQTAWMAREQKHPSSWHRTTPGHASYMWRSAIRRSKPGIPWTRNGYAGRRSSSTSDDRACNTCTGRRQGARRSQGRHRRSSMDCSGNQHVRYRWSWSWHRNCQRAKRYPGPRQADRSCHRTAPDNAPKLHGPAKLHSSLRWSNYLHCDEVRHT